MLCEDAHQKEVQEFLHRWEKIIIPEFENERLLIELETKKRHQNEIEELKESMKNSSVSKYRHSSELLNIQKQIESLASLGKYLEAKKMKKKFKRIEKLEKAKHEKTSNKLIDKKVAILKAQQLKEMGAVKDK